MRHRSDILSGPTKHHDVKSHGFEEVQLKRLASTVLAKSPDDLAALAESNPLLVWEWIEVLRRRKLEAEIEARHLSAAIAALSTAGPAAIAAE